MRSCCRWGRRFQPRHHAFDTGASPAPPAIGMVSRSGSGLRIGLPGSWVGFSRCASPLLSAPTSRGDGTYDRLSAGMDVDVLDSDVLLTLAAVTVEGFGQSRGGPGKLVRLV